MEKEQFLAILRRYRSGIASKEEIAFMEAYYKAFEAEPDIVNMLTEAERNALMERSRQELLSTLNTDSITTKKGMYRKIPVWVKFAAAVVVFFLLAGTGYWLLNTSTKDNQTVVQQLKEDENRDIHPGTNKAFLTLADGSVILLDSAATGNLAEQGNTHIIKLDSGQLAYNTTNSYEPITIPQYNVITTPRGGQYSIVLPDGSKVWLNAASSLKFPVVFNSNERKIELEGEGYFKVAPDKNKPFRVVTGNQVVQALGTVFNVNAYNDETVISTTLVEGSVAVSGMTKKVILIPGQQANVEKDGSAITVRKDLGTADMPAWVSGYFSFNQSSVESVMRQLSRWYDIEVSYVGAIPEKKLIGKIPKNIELSKVLGYLKQTGVSFEIAGSKIIVKQ